ncbi:thioesterase superfamily protein [Mycobacterium kansasii]|uniref:Thioesterase superfamily protein n=1 Tax=Mycobacterium kansasii TaxID=1768 RepID=A0A1V3WCC8_MYCKA|nr:thioesterase superfamily protein [Mycobacterium kansasii]
MPETPAPQNLTSGDFPVLWPVLTRWADNDMFGHLNNAVYYQLFDTAINAWINTGTNLDPLTTPSLGIVAESGCRYFSELHFPNSWSWAWRSPAWAAAASPTDSAYSRPAPTGRSRSPRWATGSTSTSTGPAANRPDPGGHPLIAGHSLCEACVRPAREAA